MTLQQNCHNKDTTKRDVRKAGEEEDWKNKTRDRGGWKRLSDEAVKKLRAARHPRQREKDEERNCNFLCCCNSLVLAIAIPE